MEFQCEVIWAGLILRSAQHGHRQLPFKNRTVVFNLGGEKRQKQQSFDPKRLLVSMRRASQTLHTMWDIEVIYSLIDHIPHKSKWDSPNPRKPDFYELDSQDRT